MKVSELIGALLDYWVARAEGIEHPPYLREMRPGCVLVVQERDEDGVHVRNWVAYEPSTDWSVAGPIIERAAIQISPPDRPVHRNGGPLAGWGEAGNWAATTFRPGPHRRAVYTHETSPMIAAMRAYVASKFGEQVPDLPDIK